MMKLLLLLAVGADALGLNDKLDAAMAKARVKLALAEAQVKVSAVVTTHEGKRGRSLASAACDDPQYYAVVVFSVRQ